MKVLIIRINAKINKIIRLLNLLILYEFYINKNIKIIHFNIT